MQTRFYFCSSPPGVVAAAPDDVGAAVDVAAVGAAGVAADVAALDIALDIADGVDVGVDSDDDVAADVAVGVVFDAALAAVAVAVVVAADLAVVVAVADVVATVVAVVAPNIVLLEASAPGQEQVKEDVVVRAEQSLWNPVNESVADVVESVVAADFHVARTTEN